MSLSEDTPVKMPLGRFWAIFVAVVVIVGGGTAWGVNLLRDIKGELVQLNSSVASGWTTAQQERWAARLKWNNRSIPLDVPDPQDVPR